MTAARLSGKDREALDDIRRAIAKIEQRAALGRSGFDGDDVLQDAMVRQLA